MKNSTDEASKQSRRNFAKSVIATFAAAPVFSSLTGCREKSVTTPTQTTQSPAAIGSDDDPRGLGPIKRAIRIRASNVQILDEIKEKRPTSSSSATANPGRIVMDAKKELALRTSGATFVYAWQTRLNGELTELSRRGIEKIFVKKQGMSEEEIKEPMSSAFCKITLYDKQGKVVATIEDVKGSGKADPQVKTLCRLVTVEGPFDNGYHFCDKSNEDCHYPSQPNTPDIAKIKFVWNGALNKDIVFDDKPFEYLAMDLTPMSNDDCCMLNGDKCRTS